MSDMEKISTLDANISLRKLKHADLDTADDLQTSNYLIKEQGDT